MMMPILLLVFSLFVLVISTDWIIRALSIISNFLKITDFSAAFIIMAVSTSLPELFTGINAAISNNPSLSLGNVIGANLINLSLIAGLGIVIVGGFKVPSQNVKKDSLYMFILLLVPFILLILGGKLSRIDGIILVILFLVYNYVLLREDRHFFKVTKQKYSRLEIILSPILFIICLLLLFVSSKIVITNAISVMNHFDIPPLLVGIILLAVGTSLPELSFTITSILNKKGEMSIGNIMGSVITNSTLVLGVVAMITPIQIVLSTVVISFIFMTLSAALFSLFLSTGKQLGLREGMALIFVYFIFMGMQIYIQAI